MGYIRFTDAVNRENIIDASRVLIVRSQGSNIDVVLDFHTVPDPTVGVLPGVRKQIRLVGNGFTDATLERFNLAIINAQVNLVTDFEFTEGEELLEIQMDPHPN